MKLNERIIKLYEEKGEAEFYKVMMKEATRITKSGDYKHLRIVDKNTGEHAIVQFYKKTFKLLSGSCETHYFNR